MKKIIIFIVFYFLPITVYSDFKKGDFFDLDIAKKSLTKAVGDVPTDLYNIATTPFKNPLQTLGYLGAVGALVAVDKETTVFYQQSIENPLDLYSLPTVVYDSPLTHGADSWLVFGTLAHYLGGFALGDEKSQVTSLLAMKSIGYSYAVSHVLLKSITGRNRPKDDLSDCKSEGSSKWDSCDPFDFGNSREEYFKSHQKATAMPSFHVTMYFSLAKVYQEMYDNYLIPYSMLALIYASDIKGHQHWVSDMVAGGIVGTFIGNQVVSSYRDKDDSNGFSVVPVHGGIGLSYTYNFN